MKISMICAQKTAPGQQQKTNNIPEASRLGDICITSSPPKPQTPS